MSFQDQLGSKIKFHRKMAGLSRIELADLAGVGKTALFDVENGKKSVQMSTILAIAKTLNMKFVLNGPLDEYYERLK